LPFDYFTDMTGSSMTPVELTLIKSGIDLVKRGLRMVRKKRRKHKYKECVSTVITELLKENPDLILAARRSAGHRRRPRRGSQSMLRTVRRVRVADAHRGDAKRFVGRGDEKLTAFLELEAAIRACGELA
jgi:hypothetical protein